MIFNLNFKRGSRKAYLVRATVVFLLALPHQMSAQQEQQVKIEQLNQEIERLSNELNADEATISTAKDKLHHVEVEIDKARKETQAINKQLEKSNKEQSQIEKEVMSLDSKLATGRNQLSKLLHNHYQQGRPNYFRLVLQQKDPYAVGRLDNYYTFYREAFEAKLKTYRSRAQELKVMRLKADTVKQQIAKQQQQLELENLNLQQLAAVRKKELTRAETQYKDHSEQLKALRQDRARLKKIVQYLEKQAAQREAARNLAGTVILTGKSFVSQKGQLRPPLSIAPSVKFGQRLPQSGMRSEGLLYKTQQPTNIRSIYEGQVVFADFLKGYGLMLIVDHGEQHISLYANNQVLYKNSGDAVNTGEIIAKSGTTGGLRSPGLYFEVRKNAIPVNPNAWFASQ